MDHQAKVGTARMIGYVIGAAIFISGAAIFIAVAPWKLIVR